MTYYCHFNETKIDLKECEICGAKKCCAYNLEIKER